MLRKPVIISLLMAAISGAYFFLQKYQIEGLGNLHVARRSGSGDGSYSGLSTVPVGRSGRTIRVASFNIQDFGQTKMGKPNVTNILADVIRRFDVVAIQEVSSKDQSLMPRFIDMVNATGRHYEFVIGPREGRTVSGQEQYAVVYDAASVEVDRENSYKVSDPDELLHREPLVVPVRVRGPSPSEAFTFSLVNIHTDPDEVRSEMDSMADVFMAVRNDGRNEDDIIVLGDLNTDSDHLGRLGQLPNIACAINSGTTNTRGNKMYDNIIFNRLSTTEYTGRWGVVDLLREYKLTLKEALEVSDHFPVWAEFNVIEGGQPGQIAGSKAETKVR